MRITKIKDNNTRKEALNAFINDLNNLNINDSFLTVYLIIFQYLELNYNDKKVIKHFIDKYTHKDENGNVYRNKQEFKLMKDVLIDIFKDCSRVVESSCILELHQHFDDMLEALNEFEKTHKLTSSEKVKFLKYLENRY